MQSKEKLSSSENSNEVEEENSDDDDEIDKDFVKWVDKRVKAYGDLVEADPGSTIDIVDTSELPYPKEEMLDALIVMEDRDFYIHNGINIKSTFRALIIDILSFSSKQGASTITQQLARTMYNNDEGKYYIGQSKKITRKIKELITAIKIEKTYTKSEILELYFNSVYFGHGTYGVQAASLYYFGKDISKITLDESAILIGLLPAPARYSPIRYPEKSITISFGIYK